MEDIYRERKKEIRSERDKTYEDRKKQALAEGQITLFLTCPLCGLNRPLKRWGKEARFQVKPDYFLIQARSSRGRGSGFFLNLKESMKIEEVKQEYPELYENIKKSIKELNKIFK